MSVSSVRTAARKWTCAVTALVALFAAGCADDDDETTSGPTSTTTTTTEPPAPVGGLVATIGTNRLYGINRAFGLRLQNVGEEPVVVRQVQLDAAWFEPVPAEPEQVVLPPHHRGYVLPLPYGEVRCDDGLEPALGAVVVLDDGEELRLEAAQDDPGAIDRVHERECAAAEVHGLADLGFGDEWTRDGSSVRGELTLEQRQSGADVAIDDIAGSVIFTIGVDAPSPILHVSDDAPAATVPIVITMARCDPHAMLEAKRTYKFLAWSIVDGTESVPLELEATGAVRSALEDMLSNCLGGGPS